MSLTFCRRAGSDSHKVLGSELLQHRMAWEGNLVGGSVLAASEVSSDREKSQDCLTGNKHSDH